MTSCTDTGAVETSTATPITVDEAKAQHGRAGVEFVDLNTGSMVANFWVRGICQYGVMPTSRRATCLPSLPTRASAW